MKLLQAGLSSVLMAALLSITAPAPATAQIGSAKAENTTPIAPEVIDDTVERAMKAFQVPGVAIGIVKDGKVVFAKGYGVRDLDKPDPVDTDTLFQIGSNTKAFTAAALAILVDEGRLGWDDKVIDYLPQFRMYDAYVTREFTVRDLLTHRSGLGKGAGDLMFFPATDMSREELLHGLRYLKPVSSFRAKYDYDNLLYIVAGQLIPVITGQSWEDFVTNRIFAPLQMSSCAVRPDLISDRGNIATPHVVIDGRLQTIEVVQMKALGPAGTINCNISGMTNWLKTQLNNGVGPDGHRLFTDERSAEMWEVNTPTPLNPFLSDLYGTHFSGYGLGWELSDAHGYKRVHHGGAVWGSVTWVSMIPELNLGVVVLTNQQNSAAMEAIGGQILDAYLDAKPKDWVSLAQKIMARRSASAEEVENAAAEVAAKAPPPPLPLTAYAGTYHDAWRGDATVKRVGNQLVLAFSRTNSLEGPLTPFGANIFIVRWRDRSLNADAFVRFEQGFDGEIAGMTMRAVSPATDFSFDFHDLDFKKTK